MLHMQRTQPKKSSKKAKRSTCPTTRSAYANSHQEGSWVIHDTPGTQSFHGPGAAPHFPCRLRPEQGQHGATQHSRARARRSAAGASRWLKTILPRRWRGQESARSIAKTRQGPPGPAGAPSLAPTASSAMPPPAPPTPAAAVTVTPRATSCLARLPRAVRLDMRSQRKAHPQKT
ncbi:hypothetical protein BJ912DRAFT_620242 [Pholiota molesta]|nr:hypothetical protein BJ912DRAFT_620242 [Pholiota molesta]